MKQFSTFQSPLPVLFSPPLPPSCFLQQMAEPGRTVRVTGLPTDIEDDRLKDKLEIHFLRTRNGGGEIDSVTIVKTTPICALVTFEDSRGQLGQHEYVSVHIKCRGGGPFLWL